jgi:hypothetical protein
LEVRFSGDFSRHVEKSAVSSAMIFYAGMATYKKAALLIKGMILISRKVAKAQRERVSKIKINDFIPHLCNAKKAKEVNL